MASPRDSCGSTLAPELLRFTDIINTLDTAHAVLEHLHDITYQTCRLSVMGALVFPLRWGDWGGLEKGKTVFLHKSVPDGWWDEYLELSRKNPAPGLMMAQLALAPFTMSDTMRMLEPLGVDRWPQELALKHGIRDALTCPVGGRWVVAFWSKHVLAKQFTQEARALIFMGATFAAIRLQMLIGAQAKRIGRGAALTPRELAVLRALSVGKATRETAEHLGLGEETIRSHLKKAQLKLGVHDRTHAVAQAIRRHLIP